MKARLITFEPSGELVFDFHPTSTIMGKLFIQNSSSASKFLFRVPRLFTLFKQFLNKQIVGSAPEHYVVIPSHGTIEKNEKKQIKLLMKASRVRKNNALFPCAIAAKHRWEKRAQILI